MHGGPGAAGYMAPVARGLAESFHILEPLQRGTGDRPLTVARHVADLRELIESCGGGARPALVGHSWGATSKLGRCKYRTPQLTELSPHMRNCMERKNE